MYVVVALDYDEEGPLCEAGKNGAIIVKPAALEHVSVYGPFKTERAAKKDAAAVREMGCTTFVVPVEEPNEAEG